MPIPSKLAVRARSARKGESGGRSAKPQAIASQSWWVLACIVSCCTATAAIAADPAAKPAPSAPPSGSSAGAPSDAATIAATVGGKPIYQRQIDQMLAAATHGQVVSAASGARLRAGLLLELVDRQLAQSYLDKAHLSATPEEIDAEIAHLKTELEHAKKTLPEFLARAHQSEAALRSELGWQLSWQKYLKQEATDEALDAYFKAHHRDFDGTELRVSHILLRPTVAGDDSAVAALVKEAEQIRKEIESGKITFEAAAEKYSAGPSRHRGGDLGFIPRHGPMVEPFAKAAFALDKGQISEPVATVFGIHLIRVTDVKPGEKKLADVRDAVRTALAEHLFQELVAQARGVVPVQYSGKTPYFKPGTTELVVPK